MKMMRKIFSNAEKAFQHATWAKLLALSILFSTAIYAVNYEPYNHSTTNFPTNFQEGDAISSVQFNNILNELNQRIRQLETSLGNPTEGMVAAFNGACPNNGQWVEYANAQGRVIVGSFPPSQGRNVGGTNDGTVNQLHTDNGQRLLNELPAHYHKANPGMFLSSYPRRSDGSDLSNGEFVVQGSSTGSGATGVITYNVSSSGIDGHVGSHVHEINVPEFSTFNTYDLDSNAMTERDVDVSMPYVQLTYCEYIGTADSDK